MLRVRGRCCEESEWIDDAAVWRDAVIYHSGSNLSRRRSRMKESGNITKKIIETNEPRHTQCLSINTNDQLMHTELTDEYTPSSLL